MPTASKRIQVLLKPDVMELVEGISEQDGLSHSKVASLLITEALCARGLVPGSKMTVSTVMTNQSNSETDNDAELLKKVKLLKELGLFN